MVTPRRLQRECQLRMHQTARPSVDQLSGHEKRRIRKFISLCSPINPNRPRILPKTSTMRILTNKFGSAASARAAVEPAIPTQIPQRRLHTPTVMPPQKMAKPNGQEVRKIVVMATRLRRTCEVVISGVHPGIRDGGQPRRVNNGDDLGRRS